MSRRGVNVCALRFAPILRPVHARLAVHAIAHLLNSLNVSSSSNSTSPLTLTILTQLKCHCFRGATNVRCGSPACYYVTEPGPCPSQHVLHFTAFQKATTLLSEPHSFTGHDDVCRPVPGLFAGPQHRLARSKSSSHSPSHASMHGFRVPADACLPTDSTGRTLDMHACLQQADRSGSWSGFTESRTQGTRHEGSVSCHRVLGRHAS